MYSKFMLWSWQLCQNNVCIWMRIRKNFKNENKVICWAIMIMGKISVFQYVLKLLQLHTIRGIENRMVWIHTEHSWNWRVSLLLGEWASNIHSSFKLHKCKIFLKGKSHAWHSCWNSPKKPEFSHFQGIPSGGELAIN